MARRRSPRSGAALPSPPVRPRRRALLALAAALPLLAGAARAEAPAALLALADLRGGELVAPAAAPDGVLAATRLGTEVRVEASGPIARVTLTQRFRNDGAHWREASYLLPLPEDAAVDALRIVIGERVIEGEIRAREAARAAFEAAREAGRRAALVERTRPNLFAAAVTNVPPGGEVAVTVSYLETLRFDDGAFTLRLPLAVTPRYLPRAGGVPRAEALDRPYTTAPAPPLALDATLDAGAPLDAVTSPTHRLEVRGGDDGRVARVRLAAGAPPADRDLVLRWRPRLGAEPRLALVREEAAGAEHLLVLLLPPLPEAVRPPPREVVLVVDTSGSMAGTSMPQAREAAALALARLGLRDRVNVIAFDDRVEALFDAPRPATPDNLARARRFVAGLTADGGTEMAPALDRALAGAPPRGMLRQVVFVTDGSVGNEAELFARIARRLGEARLFTVGIGSAPNAYFMRGAAEMGRGSYLFVADPDEIAEVMGRLFAKLERPALTDLRLELPPGAEAHPAAPPDLYAGEPLELAVRLAPGTAADARLRVEGVLGGTPWAAELPLAAARPRPGPAKLWARARLAALEEAWRLGGPDRGGAGAEAVTELALAYGLVSDRTSLVAVERAPVRPAGEALARGPLPEPLPAGQVFDAIFGYPDTATPAGLLLALGAALVAAAALLAAAPRRARRRRAAP